MADYKSKTGKPDRQRINTSDAYEVRDWARKFGVDEDIVDEDMLFTPRVAAIGAVRCPAGSPWRRGAKDSVGPALAT